MDRDEVLLREYETITGQITHWDTHTWRKSQFFLAIETFWLAIIVNQIIKVITDDKSLIDAKMFLIIIGVVIFNIFICYVWFRTSRRNDTYLDVRFMRARDIEKKLGMKDALHLYRDQYQKLAKLEIIKQRSRPWEVHLSSAFVVAWFLILITTSLELKATTSIIWAGIIIIIILGLIYFIEKSGWPTYTIKYSEVFWGKGDSQGSDTTQTHTE